MAHVWTQLYTDFMAELTRRVMSVRMLCTHMHTNSHARTHILSLTHTHTARTQSDHFVETVRSVVQRDMDTDTHTISCGDVVAAVLEHVECVRAVEVCVRTGWGELVKR